MLIAANAFAWDHSKPLVIDHTSLDFEKIPPQWIDAAKNTLRWHYAHTSFGAQLTDGLTRIESSNPFYSVSILYSALPSDPGDMCIFDGQVGDNYIEPGEYWQSAAGMEQTRQTLRNNPSINISMWTWCAQLSGYTVPSVQAYLDSMSQLEREFPNVTFVYATGNCQLGGGDGCWVYRNNNMIRDYCIANNKVLYDFGDLDCWWFNPSSGEWEYYTNYYKGWWCDGDLPQQHPHFNGSECDHTTYESCEQKAKAVWWMLAALAGWDQTAVAFTSFDCRYTGRGVLIDWTANASGAFEGYNVYRADVGDNFVRVNSDIIRPELQGEYEDMTVLPGRTYQYRLGAVENGTETYSPNMSVSIPAKPLTLHQNYPNPCNPSTTIAFFLPESSELSLAIYDAEGKIVRSLFAGRKDAGEHGIAWDGRNNAGKPVSTGIYYCRLVAGKNVQSRTIVLLR